MEFQFRLSIIVIINIIIITKPGASCSCTESLHHRDVRLPTADTLKPVAVIVMMVVILVVMAWLGQPTADTLKPGRHGDLSKDVKWVLWV